jgi:hypothetical protein
MTEEPRYKLKRWQDLHELKVEKGLDEVLHHDGEFLFALLLFDRYQECLNDRGHRNLLPCKYVEGQANLDVEARCNDFAFAISTIVNV